MQYLLSHVPLRAIEDDIGHRARRGHDAVRAPVSCPCFVFPEVARSWRWKPIGEDELLQRLFSVSSAYLLLTAFRRYCCTIFARKDVVIGLLTDKNGCTYTPYGRAA